MKKFTPLEKNKQEIGSLTIVGTPIGNISDFSERGKKALQESDVVAAEDTRSAKKLAFLSGLTLKKIISYNENNSVRQIKSIIEQIDSGKNVALISDAGMPLISDPGYKLVKKCIEKNIAIHNVPGPTSIISALVVSGLPTNSFYFVGFPPKKRGPRIKLLQSLTNVEVTTIWFESPKRLISLLDEMLSVFGNRQAVVARELTKLYEEIVRGSILFIKEEFEKRTSIRGELVIILEPLKFIQVKKSDDELLFEIKELLKTKSLKNVVDEMVFKTGKPKSIIYRVALNIKNNIEF